MCLPSPLPLHEDQMTLGYKVSCAIYPPPRRGQLVFHLFFFFFFLNEPTIFPIYLYLFRSKEESKEEIWKRKGISRETLERTRDQIFIRFLFFFFFLKIHRYETEGEEPFDPCKNPKYTALSRIYSTRPVESTLPTIGKLTRAGQGGGGGGRDGFLGQRVPRMLENGKYRPLEGDF